MKKESSNDIVSLGFAFLEKVTEKIIQKEQSTIEDFLKKVSIQIDNKIIKIEQDDSCKFIAGELFVISENETEFRVDVELYFKDKDSAWVKKALKGDSYKISWFFLEEDQQRLLTAKKLTFPYDPPDGVQS